MTLLRRLLCALIFTVGITSLNGCVGFGPNYADGERAGVVIRLSQKGLLIDSWEGSMTLSGAGQGLAVSEFEFSTRDDTIASDLKAALKAGTPVIVHYKQWALAPSWIDTDHVITSVERK